MHITARITFIHKRRILFQRGLLDWFLPIETLPSVLILILIKMQFVYKEMACDGAKSDVLIRI